jgi:hypothetical protein
LKPAELAGCALIKDVGEGIQGRAIVIPVGELEKNGAAYLAEVMLPQDLKEQSGLLKRM